METQGTGGPRDFSVRRKVRSLSLVMSMAMITGTLRFAMWAANQITLWYFYGWATVKHDHLRIVRVKPELVVSNGDVLHGIGAYHYFVGVGIWLPLTIGLAFLVDRLLLPQGCRLILRERQQSDNAASAIALLCVLPMAVLVTVLLPTGAALTLAIVAAAGTLIWLRKLPYDTGACG